MKTIWKITLQTIDLQGVQIPQGSELLTVQVQNGAPCLWVLCDSEAKPVHQDIAIHGTGHEIPATTGDYIGTYQLSGGALVFHVFKAL